MSNRFHFQIVLNDGKPAMSFGEHGNDIPFRTWMRKNIGKFGTIEPRDKITKEARGYFEGALVPSYIQWTDKDPNNRDEQENIRELFKLEFNGMVIDGLDGTPKKVGRSTAKLSQLEFREDFVAKIVEYFVENNIPVPNPDLYKKWKDKWSHDDPLSTFWQFLKKYNIKCDAGVEEVTYVVPVNRSKVEYPIQDNNVTAF